MLNNYISLKRKPEKLLAIALKEKLSKLNSMKSSFHALKKNLIYSMDELSIPNTKHIHETGELKSLPK